MPVDEREDCVELAFDDSNLDCKTDDSMIDAILYEFEDAGNEIDGTVHSPACPPSPSMEEETRDQVLDQDWCMSLMEQK